MLIFTQGKRRGSEHVNQDNLERTAKLFCQAINYRVLRPALAQLAKDDLTEVQLSCLRYTHLHQDPSVGEIAEGLKISNAASAKLIDRLVRKHLLTREEDPVDRRVLKIKLTPDGDRLLAEITRVETEQFQKIFGSMADDERQALEKGLVGFLTKSVENAEQLDEICLRCGWSHDIDCAGNQLYKNFTSKDKAKV